MVEVSPGGLRWRLVFAALGAIGMAIIYGLKVNLSVAVVAMLNHTALEELAIRAHGGHISRLTNQSDHVDHTGELHDGECFDPHSHGDEHKNDDGPFTWTEPQQGFVLGSYFIGYFITQIPGGRIAEVLGGKWVFLVAVIMNMVGALLSPVCSYAGYEMLAVMRIIQGLGGGVTFPAMNVMISKWAPSSERSTISSIVFGGTALGTLISLPTAGQIAGNMGWEWVFYIHGGLCAIWCVLWVIFVTDAPESHKFISAEELEFIEATAAGGNKAKTPPVPWGKIFTSVPVWALIISHTLNNTGWYMILVELPSFMRNGLGFNIKENAGLSAVPFLFNWIFSIIYSNRLDWARHRGLISTTWARKLSMAIATIIPCICLIGVCLAGCNKTAIVSLMIIGTGFYGSMFAGVFSNQSDLANNYAGVLMGISNMAATIPGVAVPAVVGILTHGETGLHPWHIVFYGTAAILALEFVVFTIFASGEEQPWNKPQQKESTLNMTENTRI